jgi:hypothetical protein
MYVKEFFSKYTMLGVVIFYSTGVVTHGHRIGSGSQCCDFVKFWAKKFEQNKCIKDLL